MTKFCGNCGAQMPDEARVCGNCGTPFNEVQQPVNNTIPPINQSVGGSNKNIKKYIIIAICAVVALGVCFGGFKLISGGSGYNRIVKEVAKSYESGSVANLSEYVSPSFKQSVGEKAIRKEYEYYMEDTIEDFQDELGMGYKVSYKVDQKLDFKETYPDIWGEVQKNMTSMFVGDIQNIVVLKTSMTAKNGSNSITRDVYIFLTQENKKWYLVVSVDYDEYSDLITNLIR